MTSLCQSGHRFSFGSDILGVVCYVVFLVPFGFTNLQQVHFVILFNILELATTVYLRFTP